MLAVFFLLPFLAFILVFFLLFFLGERVSLYFWLVGEGRSPILQGLTVPPPKVVMCLLWPGQWCDLARPANEGADFVFWKLLLV